jgi:hypothetical protein
MAEPRVLQLQLIQDFCLEVDFKAAQLPRFHVDNGRRDNADDPSMLPDDLHSHEINRVLRFCSNHCGKLHKSALHFRKVNRDGVGENGRRRNQFVPRSVLFNAWAENADASLAADDRVLLRNPACERD